MTQQQRYYRARRYRETPASNRCLALKGERVYFNELVWTSRAFAFELVGAKEELEPMFGPRKGARIISSSH